MHVYYQIPNSKKCTICKNEIDENNMITDLDLMICETCNHIYTIQRPEEIVHAYETNKDFLCGCQNKCPSNTLLAVGNQQTYFGNILKADIYRCSNCGAITFRNMGAQNKTCKECGASYLDAMHWDSSTNRIIYQCSNPKHGIRLKLRDLITDHNQKVDEHVKTIQKEEKKLQNHYEIQLQAFLKKNNTGILQKQWFRLQRKPTPTELELQKLNAWAFEERRKLYTRLHPIALRCAVYKEQIDGPHTKLIKTGVGCGALAKIKIKRVVIAPDGTIIDSEPKQHSTTAQEQSEINFAESFPQTSTQGQSDNMLSVDHESIFTQIIRAPTNISEEQEKKGENTPLKSQFESELPSIEEIQRDLPSLEKNQAYFVIILGTKKKASPRLSLFNYGILPIVFPSENSEEKEIKIGKEQIVSAYWRNSENILSNPHLFENILPNSNGIFHFIIMREHDKYYFIPNSLGFPISIRIPDDTSFQEATNKTEIGNKTEIQIPGYFSLSAKNPEGLQELQFRLIFLAPNSKKNEISQVSAVL